MPGNHSIYLLKKSFNFVIEYKKVGLLNNFKPVLNQDQNEIFIFDNALSDNKSFSQVIYTEDMKDILNNLLSLPKLLSIKFCLKIKKNKNLLFYKKYENDNLRFLNNLDD